MASIDSLPYDIINIILHQVIVTRNIRTPGDWSLLLQFLAICPSWRAVAKYHVCETGIIEISQDFQVMTLLSNSNGIVRGSVPFTNLRLIEQTGAQSCVRRLVIYDRRKEGNSSPVLNLIAISLSMSECPGISVLRRWYDALNMRQRIKENMRLECGVAMEQIVSALTNTFPFVTSLRFDVHCAYNTQKQLYTGLLSGYIQQLITFESHIPELAPTLDGAIKLTSLDLDVSGVFNNRVQTIYPQMLKSLTLRFGGLNPFWSVFHKSKTADSVQFKNLETLSLYGSYSHTYIDEQTEQQSNRLSSFRLHLPKLAHLHVENIFFTREEMKQLLNCPLERVHYKGPASGALQLCKSYVNVPSNLVLEFTVEQDTSPRQKFIRKSNELFGVLRKVSSVYCSVDTLFGYFDYSELSWTYITHLELQTENGYEDTIPSIALFPTLMYLAIIRNSFSTSNECEETMWLKDIKTLYSEPTESKIEELVLLFLEFAPPQTFRDVLSNLQWYLPMLKTIDIPSC
ncbi:hypothetical protein GGF47_001370 [Coemansia sp. RSA 2524]|nr:hypothetical protein GGF47_001370 [Coemansia sp. RSA 2524]